MVKSEKGRTKVLLDFSFFTMHLGKRNESNWAMLGSVEAQKLFRGVPYIY